MPNLIGRDEISASRARVTIIFSIYVAVVKTTILSVKFGGDGQRPKEETFVDEA